MNRGDQREDIFSDDEDRQKFLSTLGEACGKTDWQVHAYCLMRNHFHLVLETPQPNLVLGIKWLLGVYTKRFNIRHKLCGHLFAGRYKALVVEGSGNGCLRTVCDYVHLNPVRARLLPPEAALESFAWSSYREYLKPAGQRPGRLRVDRLLGEKGIPKDSEAGRGQFGLLMERRRAEESGADYEAIRRDWPCHVVRSNPPESQAASLGSPLFSMGCQGSKRTCAAALRLWRCFGEAVGLYSDNYFPGLATIMNLRKSHFPFLTQPQLKLS